MLKTTYLIKAEYLAFAALCLAGLSIGPALQAGEIFDPATVVFNAGTGYTYNFSVIDQTDSELAIVSVPAAPNSALMNLTAPTGFGISFDPGVGLVSFFEDNDSSTPETFAADSTVSGFSFTSLYGPGTVTFDALDINGKDYTGSTTSAAVAVPETTSTFSLLAGVALVGGFLVRRRVAVQSTSIQ